MCKFQKYNLPITVFVLVCFILIPIQVKVENPMLLLERFVKGGGWIEIFIVAIYGAFIAYFMQDTKKSARWRLISWSVFSIWFFLQLVLGIFVSEKFLLTGKLHIPVPAMIIAGPLYRGQLSIMTLLFLSTIILSGPAWCSQLCYFGAVDGLISSGKKPKPKSLIKKMFRLKGIIIILTILAAIILRFFHISPPIATIIGIAFGIIGVGVIALISGKKGKMVHCVLYCPVGTLVNIFKFVSPFRLVIEDSCTQCMACTPVCRYDALNISNIKSLKPGITCTLCGDCIKACNDKAIHYKFYGLKPESARRLYLLVIITLYAVFFAMGRI